MKSGLIYREGKIRRIMYNSHTYLVLPFRFISKHLPFFVLLKKKLF